MIHVGYFIIITFFIAPAAPISNIKRVLCSDWLPNPLGIVVLDPAQRKKYMERLFLDNVGDEVAKSGRRES